MKWLLFLLLIPCAAAIEYEVESRGEELSVLVPGSTSPSDYVFSWIINGQVQTANPGINGVLLPDDRRQFIWLTRPLGAQTLRMSHRGDLYHIELELHDNLCGLMDLQHKGSADCATIIPNPGEYLTTTGMYLFPESKKMVLGVQNLDSQPIDLKDYSLVLNYGDTIIPASDITYTLGPNEEYLITFHVLDKAHLYKDLCGGGFPIGIIKTDGSQASVSTKEVLVCEQRLPKCGDAVCSALEQVSHYAFFCEDDCDEPIHLVAEYSPFHVKYSATTTSDDCEYLVLDADGNVLLEAEVTEKSYPYRLVDTTSLWPKEDWKKIATGTYAFRFQCNKEGAVQNKADAAIYLCNGCLRDDVCLLTDTRTDSGYCDEEAQYYDLQPNGEWCWTDKMCASNRCTKDRCKEQTFGYKIANWLRSLPRLL